MKELLLTLLTSLVTFLGINSGNSVLGNKTNVVTTVTPTVTQSPAPTFLPPQKVIATIDPDPIVDCKFTYIGTKKLRRSLCKKSTDCQIGGKWIYYDSVDKCKADQNAYYQQQNQKNANNSNSNPPIITSNPIYNSKPLITCVVSYPCNGTSYTYQTDQYTCNFMQSGAASTCSTSDAIKKMQDISNKNYTYPQVTPIDGTIHTDPTPTCRMTPYGCY